MLVLQKMLDEQRLSCNRGLMLSDENNQINEFICENTSSTEEDREDARLR